MGLIRLGESTAEAVERALQNVAPGAARVGAVVAGDGAEQAGEQAVHGLAVPAVCADVSYVDGVTGGNVFLLPVEGARRLAAAMMGERGRRGRRGRRAHRARAQRRRRGHEPDDVRGRAGHVERPRPGGRDRPAGDPRDDDRGRGGRDRCAPRRRRTS